MLSLDEARQAALDDLDRTIATLEDHAREDWQRPTPVAGRSLLETARHLARHTHMIAGLLADTVDARLGPHHSSDDPHTPDEILGQLTEGRVELRTVLERLSPADLEHQLAPTPPDGGPVASVARMLAISCLDLGMHRFDVETALGVDGAGLGDQAVRAADIVMAQWLPQIARASDIAPESPWAVHLDGDRINRWLTWTGKEWQSQEAPGVPVTTVSGSDVALALYLCGRLQAGDVRLRITGPLEPAQIFSEIVPGP